MNNLFKVSLIALVLSFSAISQNVDVNPTQIVADDNYSVDAFGRWRVSNLETIFDSKNIFNDPDIVDSTSENQPLYFDNQEVSGGGTGTKYLYGKASQILTVSDSTAGRRVRQSKMWFDYQPGKSQLIKMTFVMHGQKSGNVKREGLFNDSNGIFLMDSAQTYYLCIRSSASGTPVGTCVSQSNWNIDKFDGTGQSQVNLDFTKAQLMTINFGWLGVATVRIGFIVNREKYYAHIFNHANVMNTVYMSTPNLPLRSEIINLGTGLADTLTQICSSVESEGGTDQNGQIRSFSTAGTHIDMASEDSVYAVFVMKLKPQYLGATINQISSWVQLQTASHKAEWFFVINPTVINGAVSYTDVPRSALSIAKGISTTTVYGGYRIGEIGVLESGTPATGGVGSSGNQDIQNAIRLGSFINGVSDSIALCVRPIGGSTAIDVEAGISWRESY